MENRNTPPRQVKVTRVETNELTCLYNPLSHDSRLHCQRHCTICSRRGTFTRLLLLVVESARSINLVKLQHCKTALHSNCQSPGPGKGKPPAQTSCELLLSLPELTARQNCWRQLFLLRKVRCSVLNAMVVYEVNFNS